MPSIRNRDGIWVNTKVFTEEADHFRKYGYYCADKPLTPSWYKYWKEQRKRIIEGYKVGGARITGEHYFYLNFCPILKVEDTSKKISKKVIDFPDFWDGDYNYFWARYISRYGVPNIGANLQSSLSKLNLDIIIPEDYLGGGYNMIVGKSRRKGYQLPHSETIITPKGKTTVGEVKVGDVICGKEGTVIVEEIYNQGYDDVYRIELEDGRSVRCGKEHLWQVYLDKKTKQSLVVDTEAILKDPKSYYIPLNLPVKNKKLKSYKIFPYLLGTFILKEKIPKPLYNIVDLDSIRENGELSIPDLYIYHTTIKDRLNLLEGIISNYKPNRSNYYVIKSCKSVVLKKIQLVCFSLGIYAELRDGVLKIDGDKLTNRVTKSVTDRVRIVKAEKLKYQETSSCFLVSGKDKLFLTTDFIVTHNSYKNASGAVRNYYTQPGKVTILNAYESKYLYPKGLFSICTSYIDFINSHTAFSTPSDAINRSSHRRASYYEIVNGVKTEKGLMSEIIAITCNDNPNANRGQDAIDIYVEESGAFGSPGLLKDLYSASEDCVLAGGVKTGMITLFGTSGQLDSGSFDYADMNRRPKAFNLLPFYNIWDENSSNEFSGFFHPYNWNTEGFYDSQGNSDKEKAKEYEIAERKKLIENGATEEQIIKRMQEKSLGPKEAFNTSTGSGLIAAEASARLKIVKDNNLQEKKGTPVRLVYKGSEVIAEPILDRSVTPITSLYDRILNKEGCVVIYEPVIPDPEFGLYKIGYDPVRQEEGSSLAAIFVWKGTSIKSSSKETLVAEYIGRYTDLDEIDRIAEKLAIYYNTQVMHENEVTSVKNYFRRNKKLSLLAAQPDRVISKNIKNSKVARVLGCHMNIQLKIPCERYLKKLLLQVIDYDEFGNEVRAIDTINSQRFLEELIAYNRKGNFDLVSAAFMCAIQVQEKTYEEEEGESYQQSIVNELLDLINEMQNDEY